jgi:hypothetical protein
MKKLTRTEIKYQKNLLPRINKFINSHPMQNVKRIPIHSRDFIGAVYLQSKGLIPPLPIKVLGARIIGKKI